MITVTIVSDRPSMTALLRAGALTEDGPSLSHDGILNEGK